MSRSEIPWFFVLKNRKIFFHPYTSSVLKASELPTVIHVAKMGELMQKHGQHRTSTDELLTQGWSKISMTIFLIHGNVPQKRYVENRKKNLYTLYLQNSRIHNNSYEWITVFCKNLFWQTGTQPGRAFWGSPLAGCFRTRKRTVVR